MMKLGVTTLGCPEWSLTEILKNAKSYGYDGIELRGVGPDLDVTQSPAFATLQAAAQTRRDVESAGLEIFAIDTSTVLTEADRDKQTELLDHAKRNIDLAAVLGAPFIRVFGGASSENESQDTVLGRLVDNLRLLGEYTASVQNVTVLLESHDAFSSARQIADVLHVVDHPHVAALWDLHHPYRHGETPEESYNLIAPYLKLVHVKDSLPPNHYCLLGEGDVPIREMLALLLRGGYDGYLSMEWEKRWHPQIAEPEVAFPQYAAKLREYLAELHQDLEDLLPAS